MSFPLLEEKWREWAQGGNHTGVTPPEALVELTVTLDSDMGYGHLQAGPIQIYLSPPPGLWASGPQPRLLTHAWLSSVEGRQELSTLPLVLVVSSYQEDLSWLQSQPIPFVIYQKTPGRSIEGAHYLPNVGKEVLAYLAFMRDYHDCLPERMLFLHGHRCTCALAHDTKHERIYCSFIPTSYPQDDAHMLHWIMELSCYQSQRVVCLMSFALHAPVSARHCMP
jgi:hypothetical protein